MAKGIAEQQDSQGADQQGDHGSVDPSDLSLVNEIDDETKTEDELWNEIAEAERAAAKSPDDDASADESAGDEESDEDAAAKAAADDGSDESDSTGDEASSDDRKDAKAAKDQGNGAAKTGEDLWANASPEHRAAYEALQAQLQNDRKRISGLTRKINELNARKPAADKAASDEGKQKRDGFRESAKWKDFEKEFPEISGPIGELIAAQKAELEELRSVTTSLHQERTEDAIAEQATLLEEQHPDWQTVAAEPEFGEWLSGQPRHIREAAIRNAEAIVDAAEAADVVGRFKAFRSEQGTSAQQESQAGREAGEGKTGTALSGKRRRQLDASASFRSRGPGVASTTPPDDADEETWWKHWAAVEKREAARA